MAKTLPDATRPQSSLDGNVGASLFQSWVMAFNAFGYTWLTVWLDSRKALSESATKQSETQDVG
ncbi:MAG: hypothetical protein EXS04_02845 [Phycisphaerales bacterium]|nr:hypothetical protein [Phycisphaerales bacterium]